MPENYESTCDATHCGKDVLVKITNYYCHATGEMYVFCDECMTKLSLEKYEKQDCLVEEMIKDESKKD